MSGSASAHVRYAATKERLYVAVCGDATHRISLTVEYLVCEFLATEPAQPEMVLDLEGCAWIDSTFAGWMIKLRKRLAAVRGQVLVSRCPKAARDSLEVMGLARLFDFRDVPAPAKTSQIDCSDEHLDADTIAFMLEAHQGLADLNPDNKRRFTPITESLRRELRKRKR